MQFRPRAQQAARFARTPDRVPLVRRLGRYTSALELYRRARAPAHTDSRLDPWNLPSTPSSVPAVRSFLAHRSIWSDFAASSLSSAHFGSLPNLVSSWLRIIFASAFRIAFLTSGCR